MAGLSSSWIFLLRNVSEAEMAGSTIERNVDICGAISLIVWWNSSLAAASSSKRLPNLSHHSANVSKVTLGDVDDEDKDEVVEEE